MFGFHKDAKLESLIGSNSEVKGDISSTGTLRIDGKVIGDVQGQTVILGSGAFVKGNVKAKTVIVGGHIDGNVKAEEMVEIKHTGKLIGDIHTLKLSVAEGGVFEGHSYIHKDEQKVIEFPAKEATG